MSLLKENVLEILNGRGDCARSYSLDELSAKVCALGDYKKENIINAIRDMEVDGTVFINEKERISVFPKNGDYVHGVLSVNKYGEGSLTYLGQRYTVLAEHLNGALDGDTVVLRTSNKSRGKLIYAGVSKVIKRDSGLVVLEIDEKNGKKVANPYNVHISYPITVSDKILKKYSLGDRILVKIDRLSKKKTYEAEFLQYIGHRKDPNAYIYALLASNGIEIGFSDEEMAQADEIARTDIESLKENRVDYTDELVFSIDGSDTKDRDDAISYEVFPDGTSLLKGHIADVTALIPVDSPLWNAMMRKCFTAYTSDYSEPLLPRVLTEGIFSLNEGVERISFTCEILFAPDGEILSYDFKDGFIKSKKAMTYEDVDKILMDGEMVPGYEEFEETLRNLQVLSNKLEKKKIARGYVGYDTGELRYKYNQDGDPIEPENIGKPSVARKIIENCMLSLGFCAASYTLAVPSPLRNHEQPEMEIFKDIIARLESSGINISSKINYSNLTGFDINRVLDSIEDPETREIVSLEFLKASKRAYYGVEAIGHFGLGLPYHGQFTSPIRRAPDDIMHVNIRNIRDGKYNYDEWDKNKDFVEAACTIFNRQEKRCDTVSREATEYDSARYMSQHIDEKFLVKVVYMNSNGIYVKTKDGVGGKIDPRDIEGDKFVFDYDTYSYRGIHSRKRITIGTSIVATCIDTNKAYRTVSFGLDRSDILTLKKKLKKVGT